MRNAKQILPAALMLLTMGLVNAQVKVYKGSSSYSGDVIMALRDGKLYEGTSTYSGDVMVTIRDNKVYSGNSIYSGDIVFTLTDFVTLVEFTAIWHASVFIAE